MKILISGFEPFGDDAINPSQDAVLALPDELNGAQVIKLILPVVRGEASDRLKAKILEHHPNVVVCVGQAGGRTGLTIERVAINVDDYPIPDNRGHQPCDEAIAPIGPAAYLLTLPNKAIVSAWREAGFPASLSNTAGTFLCNHVAYACAHFTTNHFPNIKTGFIHIPYSTSQSGDHPDAFAMTPEDLTEALRIAIQVIAKPDQFTQSVTGTVC
jgi:pyroglutamyl-peptidase